MLFNRLGKRCLTIMYFLILSGCVTVSSDFERTSKIDSIHAYEAFLSKHPGTEFEQAARTRVRELEEEKQKEKERLTKIEHEAWKKTIDQNSVSSYSNFLEAYPKSEFVIDARRAIKNAIQEIALTSVGGDKEKIRSGTGFPINLFSAKDIMEAFEKFYVVSLITYKTSQGSKQKISATMFRSYAQWQAFYGATVNAAQNASSSKFAFDVRMIPLNATVISSLHSGTTVTFYRHPEYKTSTVLRLSLHRELSNGNIASEKMAINGVGIAILRKGVSVEVYEFSKGDTSIFK